MKNVLHPTSNYLILLLIVIAIFGNTSVLLSQEDSVSTTDAKGEYALNKQMLVQSIEKDGDQRLFAIAYRLDDWINDGEYWQDELISVGKCKTMKISLPYDHGVQMILSSRTNVLDNVLEIRNELGEIIWRWIPDDHILQKSVLTPILLGTTLKINVSNSDQSLNLPIEITNIFQYKVNARPSTLAYKDPTGFGCSFPCHSNVSCPLGNEYHQSQRGVARLLMVFDEGLGYCSGSLINNTNQDYKPYMLTAFHCVDGYTPMYNQWRFDFKYEAADCANPAVQPSFVSVTGAEYVASRQETDFLLLQITSPIPTSVQAFFNGWNATPGYLPSQSVLIHHPAGDIKKIAVDNDSLVIHNAQINWNNATTTPPNSHYRSDLDMGSHQPGSSGAPVLDRYGLIIGQLHGGNTDAEICKVSRAYHGILAESWDSPSGPTARLRDWLDPNNSNTLVLDGIENIGNTLTITGQILNGEGVPIPNTVVTSSLDPSINTMTDGAGFYSLSTIADTMLSIIPTKKTNAVNGISVIDLVRIQNHILGRSLLENKYQVLAADANFDNRVSALDLVQLLNVLLGRWEVFPNSDSWRFDPPTMRVDYKKSIQDVLTGYKIGDVNDSANPSN